MKSILTTILLSIHIIVFAQTGKNTGSIIGTATSDREPVMFANVVLYSAIDSSLIKVETTNENGAFTISNLSNGNYFLEVSYVGMEDYLADKLVIQDGNAIELPQIVMIASGIELETATVTARRAIVEVKADRTVFNVQGTINSTGDNGLDLLRKAPGVQLDNNDNITVLSRTGVLIYVDGKRLPLTGDDLSNYLRNLSSDQIDKIDIITNPGAKYEAQGNAGIIDIRLKKNENFGTNGSLSSTITKATNWSSNIGGNLNYRNGKLNTYGQVRLFDNNRFQTYFFDDAQNGTRIINDLTESTDENGFNFRWGTDFFVSENQTLGFIVSGNWRDQNSLGNSDNRISSLSTPDVVDSILIADTNSESKFNSQSVNINYVYRIQDATLNVDLDYGRYRTEAENIQPNKYFTPDTLTLLSQINTVINTPVDIDILTFKVDYETNFLNGKLGLGTKLSKVATDNTFLFFDVPETERIRQDNKSNLFFYDEKVYAGYLSYARQLNQKWSLTSGLRLEQTDADGDLQTFDISLQEPPVENDYLSIFPSAGISYTMTPSHVFSLNYSRRINRPDYNVLNPFRNQLNEISFSRGNPFLRPEIVNNIEWSYLYAYRYNLKLAYSRTTDQITRLIGPDDSDPRARFINWDNLAEQIVYSVNLSAPVQFNNFWSGYFNLSGSYINNQADYGDGVVVDLQAWSYNIFQQQTFTLPAGYTAELSGWFSGPGIWGGVFKYDTSWALNLGLQKKFFDDQLSVKLSAQDIFLQAFWSGSAEFDGLISRGEGQWDSRRFAVNLNYNFGNDKVRSRNRKTGIETEEGRIGN
jgi:outer membrane receptor protein involved in Fe transport